MRGFEWSLKGPLKSLLDRNLNFLKLIEFNKKQKESEKVFLFAQVLKIL